MKRLILSISLAVAASTAAVVGGLQLGSYVHAQGMTDGGVAAGSAAPAAAPTPAAAPVSSPSTPAAAAPSSPATTAAAVPVVDPIEHPVETASQVSKLWRNGQIPSAIIVAVFSLLVVARKKFAWLQKGWQAIAVGGVVSGLTILVTDQLVAGQTPNLSMVLSAVIAAIAAVAVHWRDGTTSTTPASSSASS